MDLEKRRLPKMIKKNIFIKGKTINEVKKRMEELCSPIDQQIMMCDNREDVLMMACVMLQKVKTIFDSQIGVKGRKQILGDANND